MQRVTCVGDKRNFLFYKYLMYFKGNQNFNFKMVNFEMCILYLSIRLLH